VHDAVKELQESPGLVGGQESMSAHVVNTEPGKTLLHAKKQVAVHFTSVIAEMLPLQKLE
jgi:hypothetical protein